MKTFGAIIAISLTAGSANAADFSFAGGFNHHNEVQEFNFTVAGAAADVTLRTWSYRVECRERLPWRFLLLPLPFSGTGILRLATSQPWSYWLHDSFQTGITLQQPLAFENMEKRLRKENPSRYLAIAQRSPCLCCHKNAGQRCVVSYNLRFCQL